MYSFRSLFKRSLVVLLALVISASVLLPIWTAVAAKHPFGDSRDHWKHPHTNRKQHRFSRRSRLRWRRHIAQLRRKQALIALRRQHALASNSNVRSHHANLSGSPERIMLDAPAAFSSIVQTQESVPVKKDATPSSQNAHEMSSGDTKPNVPLPQGQQRTGTLRGQITDQLGGVMVGTTVTVTGANSVEKTAQTNSEGIYVFTDLLPGKYTVRVLATGFAPYERQAVDISPGKRELLNIKLSVVLEKQEVTVDARKAISSEPENNLTAIVLRGKAIQALPSNPRSFIAALRALAVPSAGPTLGQIYVDGFTGGRIPPKESIREIRINENPYAAEFDKLGFGRIEIFTKPGADKFQGGTFFNFNDESLNSRNPFAPNRAPYQSRLFGGNVTGPLFGKRASFFADFERNAEDNNAVINATILDPALRITQLRQVVLVPEHRLTFSPRLDYQLNPNNTLVARYSYVRTKTRDTGVGYFSLLSSAYHTSDTQHTVQLTETAVLNQNAINETRFQFTREHRRREGDASSPAISVNEAVIGGGARIGSAFNNEDRWELHNYTSWTQGRHTLKAGGQLRGAHIADSSNEGFNGEFNFGGGLAPQLDANDQVVLNADGEPVFVPITSIERYRRTILFQRQGLPPEEIRELGGGATFFSLNAGNPLARVRQHEFGAFIQDDWRLRTNFTLSAGLRYEGQNNISDWSDFAPRLSFAWAPGGDPSQPRTVIRGGIGIFYDRFSERLTLQARRANGINQQQFIVSNPAILDLFPNVPSVKMLNDFAVRQTIERVASDLRTPYTTQSSISIERQLPHNFTLAATFSNTRTLHLLRSRNINAPLLDTLTPEEPEKILRPFGNTGEIFQYESSGIFKQNQLTLNFVYSGQKLTFYTTYVLNKAMSDTDGAENFPAYSYDLRGEYGRSSLDARHSFYFGSWFSGPWGIDFNTLLFMRSESPFNITTGRDTNRDTLFAERPAFATNLTRPSVVRTRFGTFDLDPLPGQKIIPRNYGVGPKFFSINLDMNKTFTFGGEAKGGAKRSSSIFKRPYSLTLGVQVENLFNHTNPGPPTGNLSSHLFGQSYSTAGAFGFGNNPAGNRRVQMQVSFSF